MRAERRHVKSGSNTLHAKLGALRRLVRLAMVGAGLGRFACAAAAMVLLSLILDRWLRLPQGTRLVVACLFAIILAWQAAKHVLRPLGKALPEEALVLELESRWPGPADLLGSALGFAAVGGATRSSGSLRAATVRLADVRAARVIPADLVAWRKVRRWLLRGAAAMAVLLGLAALRPSMVGLWFQRNVLLRAVEWPSRTKLMFLDLPSVAPRGEAVPVRVKATGVIPRKARLEVRGEGDGDSRRIEMQETDRGVFSADLPGLGGPSTLAVRAGDARLGPRRVDVVDRPAIERARILVTPPEYVGGGPVELQWIGLGYFALRGSQVRVILTSTVPISSARCRLEGQESIAPTPMAERTAEFAFELDRDLDCEFTLVGRHGFESAEPLRARLSAVPDGAPEVRVLASGVGDALTAGAQVPLSVRVLDDCGVRAVWLDLRHEGAGGVEQRPRLPLWEGTAGREFVAERVLNLRAWDVQPGDRVVVEAGARDNCGVGEPNTAASPPLTFRVVSVHELLAALLLRQQDLRRDLEEAIRSQKEIADSAPAARGVPAELVEFERRQQSLEDLLAAVAAGYRDVLQQLLNNRILPEPAYGRHSEGIVVPLEAMSAPDGAIAVAARGLWRMQRDSAAAEAARRLLDASVLEMERVRARMLLLEDQAALITSMEEIAGEERELLRRTEQRQARVLDELLGE